MIELIKTKKKSCDDLKDQILLIITPSFPNMDESFITGLFVKYQVAELKKHFKKIIVIAPIFRSFGYLKKDRVCKDYTYANVEVYYPRCFYIPIFWLSKILIDNRLKVVKQTIKKNNILFDIIHSHFTWPSGYIGVMLKEKYGTPVIITIHENDDWFDQEVDMDHTLLNSVWSGADVLIRVNRKDVPVLKHYNDEVYTIPNGFSPAFHPIDPAFARERLDLFKDRKIIFTLGNLIKRKGFNYLIDAMEHICSQRDDVLCYIGGAGPERGNLQRQIDRLHLGDKVQMLGSVPTDILPLWMNACNVFVLPSLSESFGVVQIEAMACGKPVVATRNGGSEEVITSDEYGLLIDPADPEDLAEKILVTIDQTWDMEKILAYAERFTWENVAKEIMDVYEHRLKE
jgi:teichuronic acid biosynthesis glycosyltransferase TuaC